MSDFKPRFLKPTETSSFLDRNDSFTVETTNFVFNKNISQSIQTQRQRLPIFNNRNHILYLLEKYQAVILIGETGCGKSTQVPQNNNITKMIGPSSQISKLLLTLLILIVIFYIYMDYNLYIRIQNYPLYDGDNNTVNYKDVTWISCDINPLCDVTVKAVLLDHTNYYLFAPLVEIVDNVLKISDTMWITPNSISFFHIFVAILSAKCISSNNLAYRRIGVVLFEFRTWLDDLDGHVARVRKHIKGERSEIGTAGYYIDGICDAIGCTALMIGIFIFLKNNPPRRGYIQLPTTVDTNKETNNVVYNLKVTTKKVVRKVCCFSFQLILSSTAWNRYIALYQDLLERKDIQPFEFLRQNEIFKSSFFFMIAWLWRVVNVHNLTHLLLLSIFCDKLWEFFRSVQYIGYGVLLSVICITEINIIDAKSLIFHKLTGATNR